MTSKSEPSPAGDTLTFYRDSRRPQAWGGFFLALWMAMYIGDAVPLWIIVTGALITMGVVAAIVLKFRPLQAAAFYRPGEPDQLIEKRLILPPRAHELDTAPVLKQYEDDVAGLNFTDRAGRRHDIIVVLTQQLKTQLNDFNVTLESR